MRIVLFALLLVALPTAATLVVAPTASACAGIPEGPPCCSTIVCVPRAPPDPCRTWDGRYIC